MVLEHAKQEASSKQGGPREENLVQMLGLKMCPEGSPTEARRVTSAEFEKGSFPDPASEPGFPHVTRLASYLRIA